MHLPVLVLCFFEAARLLHIDEIRIYVTVDCIARRRSRSTGSIPLNPIRFIPRCKAYTFRLTACCLRISIQRYGGGMGSNLISGEFWDRTYDTARCCKGSTAYFQLH